MSQFLLTWAPRLLGLAVALFFSLFAFDGAWVHPWAPVDVLMNLVPAAIVAIVVVGAWRAPMAGTVGFGLLALIYAATAHEHPEWILVIAGPLALTSLLFGASAIAQRRTQVLSSKF